MVYLAAWCIALSTLASLCHWCSWQYLWKLLVTRHAQQIHCNQENCFLTLKADSSVRIMPKLTNTDSTLHFKRELITASRDHIPLHRKSGHVSASVASTPQPAKTGATTQIWALSSDTKNSSWDSAAVVIKQPVQCIQVLTRNAQFGIKLRILHLVLRGSMQSN